MHSPTHQGPPTLGSIGNLRFTQAYHKDLESIPHARRRFREVARDGKLDDDLLQKAELCLTELATNAVRHAQDPRRTNRQILVQSSVRTIRGGLHLQISVWDTDRNRLPFLPDPDTAAVELFELSGDAQRGRGLLLVASLADELGYIRLSRGKHIWCRWAL